MLRADGLGEDGMEPDTEACAETIADAFQEDFEDTFGRSGAPDGVGFVSIKTVRSRRSRAPTSRGSMRRTHASIH